MKRRLIACEKKGGKPLEEFISSLPIFTWGELPLESLSQEEYCKTFDANPTQRLIGLQQHASTRDLVIETVGTLDEILNRLLLANKPTEKVQRFGQRIDRAFSWGLISSDEKSKLHIYRKIRNRFAHEPLFHHFETDEDIVKSVRSLPKFEGSEFEIPLRLIFVTSAVGLYTALQLRIK